MSVENAKEMRHKRGQLIDQARGILDKAAEEKRELTPEERFRLVAIVRSGDAIKAVIRDEGMGSTKSYEVGDKIAEFTLDEINLKQRMIVLFGRKEDRILIGQR